MKKKRLKTIEIVTHTHTIQLENGVKEEVESN